MSAFPTALYRCPGSHQCQGGTFSCIGANDQNEFDKRIADGWHPTMPEAIAAQYAVKPDVVIVDTPASDAPPTRDEMEIKAAELGIKFDGRWSDKRLSDLIAAELAKS